MVCLTVIDFVGRVELRHLRYFVAVAEDLSFSRAAQRLHLTQPALSRQIRDLEDELGCELFLRTRGKIALTAAGLTLLGHARELLEAASRAAGATLSAAKRTANRIRIGHYGMLWVEHFQPALKRFCQRHPSAELEPVEETPADLQDALRRGELELALLGSVDVGNRIEFATRRLAVFPAWLAVGAHHPLAKRRRLALKDLREVEWIAWNEEDFPGRKRVLVDAATRAGFVPRIAAEEGSLASLLLRVAHSDAVGYVLPMTRQMPHAGVALIPLVPAEMEFEMFAAWRRDDTPVPLLEELVNCLESHPSRSLT